MTKKKNINKRYGTENEKLNKKCEKEEYSIVIVI